MKIFGWLNEFDTNAVDHIRMVQPLDYLATQGHEVSHGKFWGQSAGSDVIIGGRIALPEAAQPWTRTCGALCGPFMIFETDDDYLGLPRWNPAHRQWSNPGQRAGFLASARVSHRIVTSTDYLANLLQEQTGHPDIVVARNTIPGWMLDIPKVPNDKRPIIGWAGGVSHRGDWEWWRDGIRKAMVQLPDWTFRFVGADYTNLLRAPRMEHYPWLGSVQAYWRSPALNFDIAVAPLRPEPFNRAKSEIKLIEAGARGTPVIANRFGVYEKFVKDGETGILVSTKKEWTAAILELANDPELRAEMGAQARLQAREHTIEARWREYEEAWTP